MRRWKTVNVMYRMFPQLNALCIISIFLCITLSKIVKRELKEHGNTCTQFIPNPLHLKYKLVDFGIPFSITVRGIHESFVELGIAHEVVQEVDMNDQESVYILLTTHEDRPLPPRYISYNMEQLTVSRLDPQWIPRLLDRFRNAYEVWDYSPANVEFLHSHNIHAVCVPYGYSPFMTTSYTTNVTFSDKSVDFLFVGSLNQLRQDKMRPILDLYTNEEQPYRTFVTGFTFGDDLDRAYARSKTTLNIHFYVGETVLEVHRILPMIANKVWVFSERSHDDWYDNEYSNLIDFVDVSNPDFVQKYKEVMDLTPEKFMELLDRRLESLKAKPYTNYIKFANTSAYIMTTSHEVFC